jgi:3-(3-hydroxy-phenyl)propionate hydroxylase
VGRAGVPRPLPDRRHSHDVDFPTERWFWFDPPFHPNHSTLLHRQADDVWRVDFQLGQDADPEEEKKPERIMPRLRAMLGESAQFDIEWASVYTFACRRMQHFGTAA